MLTFAPDSLVNILDVRGNQSLDDAPAVDPVGGETGDIRVFRGGGWFEDYGEAQYCRAASRPYSYRDPYFRSSGCGFRLALDE